MNTKQFDKKIKTIFNPILAPFEYMGYLTEYPKTVRKIGVGLGLNKQVIKDAIEQSVDVLVLHNCPEELTSLNYYKELKRMIINANISLYRAHLPMDFAAGGLIDLLCELLGFKGKQVTLIYNGTKISGGVYFVKTKVKHGQLLTKIRSINPISIRVAGNIKNEYKEIAITTGDGCKPEFLDQIRPDVFICGLLNQESIRIADDLNITLIEATSHATENEPLRVLTKNLNEKFPVDVVFIDSYDSLKVY